MRIPNTIYRDIETDGEYFGVALQSRRYSSHSRDLLYLSNNGLDWSKTNITAGGVNYEFGTFQMKKVNGINYILSENSGCGSIRWINQMIKTSTGYTPVI